MNRQTIVERALCVLVPLLGFALFYGLPMLGLHFAVEHGLYVASAATIVPFLRATPLERIAEVRGYHEHDGRRCAHVVLAELDGAPEFECCIWVDELHVEGVRQPHTLFTVDREKVFGDVTENRQPCTCGHRAAIHLSSLGGGCWATRPEGGLACECEQYTPDLLRNATKNPQASQPVGADTLDDYPDVIAEIEVGPHTRSTRAVPRHHNRGVFSTVGSIDAPELDVEQIPALIDALTNMHRGWLHAGGAA